MTTLRTAATPAQERVDGVTRRRRGAVVAAMSLPLALLAACGSDDAPPAGADTEVTTSDIRTVSGTAHGDVEVPAEPERVVTLWNTGSQLLELGVVPVGSLEGEFDETTMATDDWAEVSDLPTVGTWDDVDVEAIIELQPDLILSLQNPSITLPYDQLSAVAPTVVWDVAEPTDVWRLYPAVAEAVGLTATFDEELAELDADLTALADQYGAVLEGTTWISLSGAEPGTFYLDTSESLMYERLSAAGFTMADSVIGAGDRYVVERSYEQIPELAEVTGIFHVGESDGSADEATADLISQESFQRLTAAQDGHVFPLRLPFSYTFEAADLQVEDMRAALAATFPEV